MGTDIHIVAEYFRDGCWHLADVDVPRDRNYWAFAVLADVRNGYSFGGIDSGDPVTPISEPRGLPHDLSTELRTRLEDEGDGGLWLGEHSFSWVTLEELLGYDLDVPVTQRAAVPPDLAERYRTSGEPPSLFAAWCQDPSWERLEWQEPLRDRAWLIPQLIEAIRHLGMPQHVRLVFGFDC